MSKDCRGTVLKADDLLGLVKAETFSRSAADILLASAEREAKKIVSEAREAADREREKLIELSDDVLRTFISEDAIKRHANEFIEILKIFQEIRKLHDEITPWCVDIVHTAIEQILGTFENKDLIARTVSQAILDLECQYKVTLRVCPESVSIVKAAVDSWPDALSSVQSIVADPKLSNGEMYLDCSAGKIELTISTQLDAVCAAIEGIPLTQKDIEKIQ